MLLAKSRQSLDETTILEIKPPSTYIRIFLNSQLFLCGSGFRPQGFSESGSRRIRYFLNPLCREEIFKYVINPESCGRSIWNVTRRNLLTRGGRWGERPDGLMDGDVWHFRLVGAKSGYFLIQWRSAQFFAVNIQDGAQRNIIASLLLAVQFQAYNVCAVKPTIRDKSSWHTCVKRVLLSTISSIYYFILFKHRKSPPPHPESMLFVVKERLEGLKHNIGLGGRGWEYKGEGDRYVHCSKGPFYRIRSVSTRLFLIVAMTTVHFNSAKRRFDILKLLSM